MKKLNNNKELLVQSFIFVFIFGLIAHAFCYFNTLYSHDSLYSINQQLDIPIKIANGRFMQLLNFWFRGYIVSPWLIGFLSLVWLSFSSFLIIKLLNIEVKLLQIAICILLVTNQSLSATNATYLHEADSYMLALLFAVLAIYVLDKYKYGFIFTPIFIAVSCGFYQAYFSVSITLLLILVIKYVFDNLDNKTIIYKTFKGVILLIVGLIVYYILYNLVLNITGIPASDRYNSLELVFDYSYVSSIPLMILDAIKSYIYVVFIEVFSVKFITAFILLFALSIINLIILVKINKISKFKVFLIIVAILLLPFSFASVGIISKGIVNSLTVYSFVLCFIAFILIFQNFLRIKSNKIYNYTIISKAIFIFSIVLILISNIIISNEMYLYKSLLFEKTLSTVTRIIDDMEKTEGYVMGETEIVLIYDVSQKALVDKDQVNGYTTMDIVGMDWDLSANADFSFEVYLDSVLSYPINYCNDEVYMEYRELEEVKNMPEFPEEGYCEMIDGRMVVKILEDLDSYYAGEQ